MTLKDRIRDFKFSSGFNFIAEPSSSDFDKDIELRDDFLRKNFILGKAYINMPTGEKIFLVNAIVYRGWDRSRKTWKNGKCLSDFEFDFHNGRDEIRLPITIVDDYPEELNELEHRIHKYQEELLKLENRRNKIISLSFFKRLKLLFLK